jgi:hypothetical protein
LLKKKRLSPSRKRIKYRSKFEGRVADELEKRGKTIEYEPEKLSYSLHLQYKPDWKVDGSFYVEAKGKFDYVERRKMLAVLAENPDKDIRMVFMRNQKLGKGSKMTYGEFCDKHGIQWTVFPNLPI